VLLLSLAGLFWFLGDMRAAVIIGAMVVLAITTALIQEHRSNNVATELRSLVKKAANPSYSAVSAKNAMTRVRYRYPTRSFIVNSERTWRALGVAETWWVRGRKPRRSPAGGLEAADEAVEQIAVGAAYGEGNADPVGCLGYTVHPPGKCRVAEPARRPACLRRRAQPSPTRPPVRWLGASGRRSATRRHRIGSPRSTAWSDWSAASGNERDLRMMLAGYEVRRGGRP